ncbi:MAG: NADH-quinone oxidoreductase subunit NuoK [Candidatus Sericytochromatia bacterium]
MSLTLYHYLFLAAVLFCIGIYGVLTSKNAVRVLMSLEIALAGVSVNLVAFSNYITPAQLTGQIFTIFIMTVSAAEAGVGLAIIFNVFKNSQTADMERISTMKW